ncbi:hypothetical protein SASPL_137938 [Salvia splendens]|uniref:non-specific serine/threonine protein kinase n=1 Tax=Salvia splendens TaxID=180675 RepID=A0A8X8WTS5_SALSN|nr:hypothetical protein SASPL_137938 [Salvia splendens]
MNLNLPISCNEDGRMVGKLFISNKEIAKGSNGTIVLEGIYEGRPVAVKRLVRAYNDIAVKEIQNLISPTHPTFEKSLACDVAADYSIRLDYMDDLIHGFNLWNSDGYPSPLLLKLMRDMISGVSHLHELEFVHRDLKPQNVLILNERSLCAKLSDMGISKHLVGDMSTLSNHGTVSSSLILLQAADGRHHEQSICLASVVFSFSALPVADIPLGAAWNAISTLQKIKPKASDVLNHPLFWSAEMRLSFLRDTSDRVELEDREVQSDLLKSLENIGPLALGGRWNEKLDPSFLNNIGQYRFHSVRDLLRVMRNKLSHYREIPAEIQQLIGAVPEGFDRYFRSRFPKLLIEVYKVMSKYCSKEDCFAKYFNGPEF